jgi:hypothetical protein
MDKLRKALTVLTMPVLAGDASWGVPERLAYAVWKERKEVIDENREDEYLERATLAEVAAYLYGLSLTAPLREEYAEIYIYTGAKGLEKVGESVPEDFRVELSAYQKELLRELQRKIRHACIRESAKRLKALKKRFPKLSDEKLFEQLYYEKFLVRPVITDFKKKRRKKNGNQLNLL